MILFCDNENFQKKTTKFFEKLININNHNKKDILLDQGGSIWNPYKSTKYYINAKCILIFRDPRDIFSEFKGKSAFSYPGNDAETFCYWYKKILSNINTNELKKSNMLKINFEDFAQKNNNTLSLISEHILTEINTENTDFDFSKSAKNVCRFKENLSNNEIEIIEKNLKEYLYI